VSHSRFNYYAPHNYCLIHHGGCFLIRIYSGKTTLKISMTLGSDGDGEKREMKESHESSRTKGVEIATSVSISTGIKLFGSHLFGDSLKVIVLDHGGQDEFHVTYYNLMGHPMSVFAVVIPVAFEDQFDGKHFKFQSRSTAEDTTTTERLLAQWLGKLSSLIHKKLAFVTVILNTFGPLNEAVVNAHGRKCQEIMHRFNSNSGVFENKILGVHKR
jgi:hypothetical protein